MPRSAEEKSLAARVAALESWAFTDDRAARTANARAAALEKFADQVDPEHQLDPAERLLRAESLRKAHMARISLQAAKARRIAQETAS